MKIKKFIILVNAGIDQQNACVNAYQFTKTALINGHQIINVFFYQNGVTQSNQLLSPASDEFNLNDAWQDLASEYGISLTNCVSAALRRGILSAEDAKDQQNQQWNCEAPFNMGGLGELITGIETADRLVRF